MRKKIKRKVVSKRANKKTSPIKSSKQKNVPIWTIDEKTKKMGKIILISSLVGILLLIILMQMPFFQLLSSVEHSLDENVSYHASITQDFDVSITKIENGSKTIEITDGEAPIAEVSIPQDGSGSLGKITVDTNAATGAAVFHTEAEQITEQEKILYVPREDFHTRVRICEGATSTDQVYDGCIQEDDVTDEYVLRRGDPRLETTEDGKFWKVLGITGTGGYGENISVDCYNGTGTLENVSLCDINHYNYSMTIVEDKWGPAEITNISRFVENGVKKNNALYDKTSEVYPGDFINFVGRDSGGVFRDTLFLNRFMFLYNKSGIRYNMTALSADSYLCGLSPPEKGTGIECVMNNSDVSVKIEYLSKTETTKPVIFYETTNIGVSTIEQIEYYSYYDFDINFYEGQETRDDFDAVIIHSDQSTTVEGIQKEGTIVCDAKGLPNEIDLTACSEAAGDSFILRQQIKSPTGDEVLGGLATEFSSDQVTIIEEAFANPSTDSDGLREVPPAKIDSSGSGGVLNQADAVIALSLTAGSLTPGERFSKYLAPLAATNDDEFIDVINQNVPGTPIRIDNVVARNMSGDVVDAAGAYYPLNITADMANTGGVALTDLSINCTIVDGSLEIVMGQGGTMNISSTEPVRRFACDQIINEDNSLAPDNYSLLYTATYGSLYEQGNGSLEILSDFEGSITNSLNDSVYLCGETVQVTSNITNIGNTNFTGTFGVDLYTVGGTFVENIATQEISIDKDQSNQPSVQKTITECSDIPTNYTVRSNFNVTDSDEGLESLYAEDNYVTDDVIDPSVIISSPINSDYLLSTVNFTWTSSDDNDLNPMCNLTIDSNVAVGDITTTNGTSKTQEVSSLSETTHYWNVTCWDNVNNSQTSETRSFTTDVSSPAISNFKIYSLDSSQNVIGDETSFTIDNLEQIEYMLVNFTLSDVVGTNGDIGLYFTANGTNACSLGNNQSASCYSYPNFIEFRNGSATLTYDAINGNQGDSISCTYTGNDNQRDYSCLIDEHYNPNVWKHYPFNFSDLKWQTGVSEQLNNHSVWKIDLDTGLIPLDADYYKVDFRVNPVNNPSQKLFVFLCNSSYNTGDPETSEECSLVTGKYANEFQDDGTKYRALFTNDLISSLGDLKYVLVHTKEETGYYAMKTYKYLGTGSSLVQISLDHGGSYSSLSDGYETDLNINWFYDVVDSNPTQTVFRVEGIDDLNNFGNSSDQTLSWNVLDYNIAPVVNLNTPRIDDVVSGFVNITWSSIDANSDSFLTSVTVVNSSGTTAIAGDLTTNVNDFYWDTKEVSNGNYDLVVQSCESATSDLFCNNETIQITVNNTVPLVFNLAITDLDYILRSTDTITVSTNVTDDKEIVSVYVRNSLMSQEEGSDTWSLTTTLSNLGCSGTSCALNFNATEADGNFNDTEYLIVTIDDAFPIVSNLDISDADNLVKSTDEFTLNITVTDIHLENVTLGNETILAMNNIAEDLYQLTTTANGLGCTTGDGTCELTISAIDVVGNINDSVSINLSIDDINPSVGSLSNNDGDNLIQSSDEVTYSVTVTDTNTLTSVMLNGGSDVAMIDQGGNLYQVTTTANSLGCSATDGDCVLTVIATDLLGNINSTTQLTMTIDDINPSVGSLSSNDGDNLIQSTDSVTYSVTVTDTNTLTSVFLNGGSDVAMVDQGGNLYQVTTTAANLGCITEDGDCVLTVTATDAANNFNSTTQLTMTIDDINPSVSSLTNSDGDNLIRSTDEITYSVTVTDTNTLTSVVLNGGSDVAMVDQGSNLYQVTTTATNLGCAATDGDCVLTVTATDLANNVNSTSQLTMTIDDVNPNVGTLGSSDGDNLIQSSDSVTYSVTVTDTNTLTSVVLNGGSDVVMSNLEGSIYSVTTTADSLGCAATDGGCVLTVTATDLLGNTNGTTQLTVTIDDVNPSVGTLTSNDGDNLIQSTDEITYSVIVTDTNTLTSVILNGGSDVAMVDQGGNLYQVTTTADSLGCTADDGDCVLTVTATDAANNINSAIQLTMTIDDVNPSVGSLSSSDGDDLIKSTDEITYSVTVTDTNALTSVILNGGSDVAMVDQGGNLYQVTTTADSLGCSADDGDCVLTVTATDAANNINSAIQLTMTIDDLNPSISSVSIDDQDSVVQSDQNIIINATITDTNLDTSTLFVANESSVTMALVSGNLYSVTTSASSLGCVDNNGPCTLTLSASDIVGNSNLSEQLTIIVDDVGPSVSSFSVSDADNLIKSSDSVTYSVTVTDANTIASVTLGNESNIAMSNTEGDTYSVTTATDSLGCSAEDGPCILTLTATDAAGHINSNQQSTITIDDVNPSIDSLSISDTDSIVRSSDSITINASITDTNLDSSTIFVANKSNVAMSLVSGNMYSATTSASALGCTATDGVCTLTFSASDDVENSNVSEQITITIDGVAPSVISLSANESLVNIDQAINFTVQISETNSLTSITLGGSEMEESSSNYYFYSASANELGCTSSGSCELALVVSDIASNTNNGESISFTVDSSEPTFSLNTQYPPSGVEYSPNADYYFNISVSDNQEVNQVLFEFDGFNYSASLLSGSVYGVTLNDLAGGSYNYAWYAIDSVGNLASTSGSYEITKSTPGINLTILPDTQVDYPSETNATCISNITGLNLQLSKDGSPVSNPYSNTLNLGVYNFSCEVLDNSNYTSVSTDQSLAVLNLGAKMSTLSQIKFVLVDDPGVDVSVHKQTTEEEVYVLDKSKNFLVGKMTINFGSLLDDLSMDGLSIDYDTNAKKGVMHKSSFDSSIDSSKTLYIPYSGTATGEVYICPGASSIEEVTSSCSNKVTLHEGETINGMSFDYVELFGQTYYEVNGITGTGGGEGGAPYLTSPSVNPGSGSLDTNYQHSVIYTDNENDVASSMILEIDGTTNYSMSEVDTNDVDVTDGKQYELNLTGHALDEGTHNVTFYAFDEASVPASPASISGSTVTANSEIQLIDGSGEELFYTHTNISLYVNYSQISGEPISPGDGANCKLTTEGISEADMGFDSGLYNYTIVKYSAGDVIWIVNCTSPSFDDLTSESTFEVLMNPSVPEFGGFLLFPISLLLAMLITKRIKKRGKNDE